MYIRTIFRILSTRPSLTPPGNRPWKCWARRVGGKRSLWSQEVWGHSGGVLPGKLTAVPWKSMVVRCIPHWNNTFLGDTLVFRGVNLHRQRPSLGLNSSESFQKWLDYSMFWNDSTFPKIRSTPSENERISTMKRDSFEKKVIFQPLYLLWLLQSWFLVLKGCVVEI